MPVDLELGLTLQYLATGINFSEMHNAWRVVFSTVRKDVVKVCEAIITEFQDEVMETPANEDEWKEVAWWFQQCCNLPSLPWSIGWQAL